MALAHDNSTEDVALVMTNDIENLPQTTSYLHKHDRNTPSSSSSKHKIAKRIALISSSVAALASGTPYLYGVYSPQLINRCGFSALDSSYLSFSGNIGSSIGGFFAGLIIDKFGITLGILLGALLEFTGFFTFYLNYKYSLHNFEQLVFAMICIGFGSVLAYFATIKVATLNFPNHRGFANACPVSSYGLAALFYAFVSTVWFADNIEGLLKFIALFAGIVIATSSFFIRIYENENDDDDDDGNNEIYVENVVDDSESISSSEENELEMGLKYLLKGHRGSFVQAENLLRNQSSSSLFSDMSEVSSIISSTPSSSRNSSIASFSNQTYNQNQPISINNQSGLLRSNSNANLIPSSPLDFKMKQSSTFRSGSFRINNSINNSPRNGRFFGSVNQKQLMTPVNSKITPTQESPLIGNSSLSDINHTNNSFITSFSSSPNILIGNSPKSTTDLKSMKPTSSSTNIPISLSGTFGDNVENSNENINYNINNYNLNNHNSENNSNLTLLINKNKAKKHRKKRKRLTPKEHILELLKNKTFLSEYVLNAFYASMGQVYIFSIGFIVRAQVNYYREHNPSIMTTSSMLKLAEHLSSSPTNLAVTYQALQVSIISFSNFLGRLVSGPASDLLHKKFKLNKLYVIVCSLMFLTVGQITLLFSNTLDYLSITSFLIGLSYGSIYGTMPSIIADTFGSNNFATTWALMGTGPIGIFLVLSDYFGTVYDYNSEWSYLGDVKLRMCLKGKDCYWDVFAVNTAGCLVLFVGYMWLILYQNRMKK